MFCNSLETSQKHEFAWYLWNNISPLVPETLQFGHHAEEFCGVATTVLRSLDDTQRQNLHLAAYIEVWCDLLLKHHHDEVGIFRYTCGSAFDHFPVRGP